MTNKLFTAKLPQYTRQQLDELAAAKGMTLTQVVVMAIDHLYRAWQNEKAEADKLEKWLKITRHEEEQS